MVHPLSQLEVEVVAELSNTKSRSTKPNITKCLTYVNLICYPLFVICPLFLISSGYSLQVGRYESTGKTSNILNEDMLGNLSNKSVAAVQKMVLSNSSCRPRPN